LVGSIKREKSAHVVAQQCDFYVRAKSPKTSKIK
jgi:hypothetical protein